MYDLYDVPQDTQLRLRTLELLIVEEDLEKHQKALEECIKNHTALDIIYRIKTRNGIKHVWARGSLIYDEMNKPLKLAGVVQKITAKYIEDVKLQNEQLKGEG